MTQLAFKDTSLHVPSHGSAASFVAENSKGLSAVTKRKASDGDCCPPQSGRQTKFRRTLSRCSKSFASMHNLAETTEGPKTTTPIVSPPASPTLDEKDVSLERVNTLEFQLSCVEGGSSSPSDDLACLLFPKLPATVSESSCSTNGITALCIRQQEPRAISKVSPASEPGEPSSATNSNKYGWFVVMDDDFCDEARALAAENVYKSVVEGGDLAFTAPTAPKRISEEEEQELAWAAAADTVDDVLGDFF